MEGIATRLSIQLLAKQFTVITLYTRTILISIAFMKIRKNGDPSSIIFFEVF